MEEGIQSYITDFISCESPVFNKTEWMAYLLKNKELVLLNLITEKEKRVPLVSKFAFNNRGDVLVLKVQSKDSVTNSIIWMNLTSGSTDTI